MAARPRFFVTPEKLRAWFEQHHATSEELLLGYHKVGTGKRSVTWAESVDEALCFGWIDGVRRSIDDGRYTIRFTPRRARSVWSRKNLARYAELEAEGRVHASGRRTFDARDEELTGQYSFEQDKAEFTREQARTFRANRKAWAFFQSQPPSYRTPATWWVVSAKKEETRARRLATLIDDSARGERIKPLRRLPPPSK
jgi:uncharacterized protein YdeI (YjbR/CyaY-like superfamily)